MLWGLAALIPEVGASKSTLNALLHKAFFIIYKTHLQAKLGCVLYIMKKPGKAGFNADFGGE